MPRPKNDYSSVRLCEVSGYELRLTPGNRLFVVAPNGERAFPYLNTFGQLGLSGPIPVASVPKAVEEKIRAVLLKIRFVKKCSHREALSEPDVENSY